jgi:hypothetical protein
LEIADHSGKLQKKTAYLIVVEEILNFLFPLSIALTRISAGSGPGRFVTTVVTVVGARFEYFAETLTAGYVTLVRGRNSVFVVDETASQGIVAGTIVEIGTNIVFDAYPTATIIAEQSIGEIIQSQAEIATGSSNGKCHSGGHWSSVGWNAITGEISHSVAIGSGSYSHAVQ